MSGKSNYELFLMDSRCCFIVVYPMIITGLVCHCLARAIATMFSVVLNSLDFRLHIIDFMLQIRLIIHYSLKFYSINLQNSYQLAIATSLLTNCSWLKEDQCL